MIIKNYLIKKIPIGYIIIKTLIHNKIEYIKILYLLIFFSSSLKIRSSSFLFSETLLLVDLIKEIIIKKQTIFIPKYIKYFIKLLKITFLDDINEFEFKIIKLNINIIVTIIIKSKSIKKR